MSKKYQMHVISGTHWDREWRHTAEQSKLRLVELMDSIIKLLETKETYKCFCVDGGTVVLEDYLSIRPENSERVKALIKAKRMQIVNWYTLPETFTVAPEALIRNLLLGFKMADEFGGGMKSGYTATSYGQTSQLPQIYNGFGIDTAIFYRGMNKFELPPYFLWEGADGSKLRTLKTYDEVTRTNWYFYVHYPMVLGKAPKDLAYYYDRSNKPVHLCDQELYEKAFVLLNEEIKYDSSLETMKKALGYISEQAIPYAVGKHLLALNMEDNDQPFEFLPEMIQDVDKISPDIEIIQNSLDEYMELIKKEMEGQDKYVHKGELRYPAVIEGFNGLLGANHSSRMKLKILNEKAETKLIYQAEPFASIASVYGNEYPKALLDRAWAALLKNHAHDSICGAAVDQAHEDMLCGFSVATSVADEVTMRSIISVFSKINTYEDFSNSNHTITLFNMLNFPRKEVVPLVIDFPRGQKASVAGIGFGDAVETGENFDIVDQDGNRVNYTVLSKEAIKIGVERELDAKSIKLSATRERILIETEIPQMGYKTYGIRMREANYIEKPQIGPNRQLIARENGLLENERLLVKINSNGTFSMLDKTTNKLLEDLHYFTDSGELGVAHLSIKPQRNPVITSLGSSSRITMVESTIFRGVFKIELSISIPTGVTLDGRDRLKEIVELPITTWLTLDKGGKFLKIKTQISNKARDHKLCVNFPTGINTDLVASESAFDVVKRSVRWTENGDNFEQFYPFQPMQNFVDLSDGEMGFAVLNKGIREYEVMDDKNRTIAITLLRTQRAYMTANSNMTPDEFDKYTGSHSFGDIEYNYALYPHAGDWDTGGVLKAAYQHKVDVKAIQGVPSQGRLPANASFISVNHSDKIMLSALKKSENGKGYILRLWNSSSEKLEVKLSTILPFKTFKRLRLDETLISDLKVDNDKINFILEPHKIETLYFDN